MKKILIMLVATVAIDSCEKKKCWECTLKYAAMPTNVTTICDKTRTEIDDIIRIKYLVVHNDSARFFMECH